MTIVTNTSRVLLNADPAKVFTYVSDLTRHPEWSGGPLKIEAVSRGSVSVGSKYHSTGGKDDRPNDLTVTVYEPPARFAFTAKDPTFGDVMHEFTFLPQASGTLMERRVTGAMSPMLALMFRVFIYPLIGKPLMDKAMASLKARFEQRT